MSASKCAVATFVAAVVVVNGVVVIGVVVIGVVAMGFGNTVTASGDGPVRTPPGDENTSIASGDHSEAVTGQGYRNTAFASGDHSYAVAGQGWQNRHRRRRPLTGVAYATFGRNLYACADDVGEVAVEGSRSPIPYRGEPPADVCD